MWESILTEAFIVSLFAAALRMATPLIFCTAGELINEKSGVMNLGIEGIMCLGAFTAFCVAYFTGNIYLGMLAGGLAGSLASLLVAVLSVSLGIDQVVVGLGTGFAATGLSYFLYRLILGTPMIPPTTPPASLLSIPLLSGIPVLGPALFQQNIMVYVSIACMGVIAWILYRTSWGLAVRTVGQNPATADTIGVNVVLVRYASLLAGGFLIALGGGFLSVIQSGMFVNGMIAGRGWIGIALVVFGAYHPGRCLFGALLFGFIDALQLRLQSLGVPLPYQYLAMLPYLITLIALVKGSRSANSPAALKLPFRRES